MIRLDGLDHNLLRELTDDGRASYQELARRVGLSPTATADRVRRLVANRVILGFTATVDPAALGRNLEALIDVTLESPAERRRFVDLATAHQAVLEATHVTGVHDYVLHVVCTGTAELDDLLDELKREGGVVESNTRLLLHRFAGGALGTPQPPPSRRNHVL